MLTSRTCWRNTVLVEPFFFFTDFQSLNVFVFFKHWAFIANRQFVPQEYIFSVHETRKTHFHHAVRCQQWLSITRHSRWRFCTAHARQGGKRVWQMGSLYFCDVCTLHHIWINYFVICMIYELISFLQRRLLKHRTTVKWSDLASRAYAGVEPINLSRT